MNARDALIEYFVNQQVVGPDNDPAAWFDDPWYRVPIGKYRIPILPLFGLRPSLTLHDLNHLISGYDLSPRGEVQSAAWELGSGGFAPRPKWTHLTRSGGLQQPADAPGKLTRRSG